MREKGHRASLRRRYGIDVDEYNARFNDQGGCCAICHRPADVVTKKGQRLAVDHDHTTGRVRGLLCHRCNTGLHFLENVEWKESAMRYLRECTPVLAQAEAEVGSDG